MILRLAKNLKSNTMKQIDDYTIVELKEIIRQREQKKDWKKQAVGVYFIDYRKGGLIKTTYHIGYQDDLPFMYNKQSDAELFAKKVDLFNRMNLFALIHNEGWKADWSDEDQDKWGIEHYKQGTIVSLYMTRNALFFGIAVKSREIAEAMLEEFKDELEIYLK